MHLIRSIVISLIVSQFCRAQKDAALFCGAGAGQSFYFFQSKIEMLEMQFTVLGSRGIFSAEFDYCVQPKSYFGIKNKLIALAGFNTALDKKVIASIMGGCGYFSGTRFRTYEDFDPLRVVFYPNRFNLVAKAGMYYKFGVMKNFALGLNIFFTSDKYNYAIHYGTVYVVNYNFTGLVSINYVFKK